MKTDTRLHDHMAATAWFRRVMDTKLHENNDKGHWGDINWRTLLFLLNQEVDELREELTKPKHNPVAIAREAADVANFAMMIADNARHNQ